MRVKSNHLFFSRGSTVNLLSQEFGREIGSSHYETVNQNTQRGIIIELPSSKLEMYFWTIAFSTYYSTFTTVKHTALLGTRDNLLLVCELSVVTAVLNLGNS